MKDKLFDKALIWVRRKGFEDIKANNDDFESPIAFSKPNEETQIVPDITGKIHGNKSYIEIVTKEGDVQSDITKWKLLATVASKKGGKLFLLASRGTKSFADKIVKNYNLINAKVISI